MNPLKQSIEVWCTTYPRRVTQKQLAASNADEVYDYIVEINGQSPGYISVYGFPEGHTTEGGVPLIDTMYIDFDIPRTGVYRGEHIGNPEAWEHDMGALLERVREIARVLVAQEKHHYWRAALSGHKGVHLYLDFDPVPSATGDQAQFRNGLRRFANDMVGELEKLTRMDLQPWVDVTSSDLARLTRLPNTIHDGATAAFGERRYCVPVSIEELSAMTPERYVELTRSPRPLSEVMERTPSEKAAATLRMYVRQTQSVTRAGSQKTGVTLTQYDKEHANHEIELDDLPFILTRKPCLWHFRDRDDMFDYDNQSHMMKLAVLSELYNNGVPVEVIREYFDGHPEHDWSITKHELAAVVGYGYRPWKHETIVAESPVFMDERCVRCQSAMGSRRASTTVPSRD